MPSSGSYINTSDTPPKQLSAYTLLLRGACQKSLVLRACLGDLYNTLWALECALEALKKKMGEFTPGDAPRGYLTTIVLEFTFLMENLTVANYDALLAKFRDPKSKVSIAFMWLRTHKILSQTLCNLRALLEFLAIGAFLTTALILPDIFHIDVGFSAQRTPLQVTEGLLVTIVFVAFAFYHFWEMSFCNGMPLTDSEQRIQEVWHCSNSFFKQKKQVTSVVDDDQAHTTLRTALAEDPNLLPNDVDLDQFRPQESLPYSIPNYD